MFRYDLKPIWEGIKEPLRLAVLAAASTFVTTLLNKVTNLPQTETIIILTFVLRLLDSVLHEVGKHEDNKNLTLGLVRF